MLCGLSLPSMAALFITGLLLDACLGEVSRWHPLVGFGRHAHWIENRLNHQAGISTGVLAWMLAVLPFTLIAGLAVWLLPPWPAFALHALLLYFCLGLRSLHEHCMPIARALEGHDLPEARRLTARIVSRDTEQADEEALAKAAVESLLENGNDAVFGTLFWFAVAGGPGALLFRLANTLDAMWGYRTPRFLLFGRFAARCDDVLNWIPARLTTLSYLLFGDMRRGWHCWRTQAPNWSSPNAGPVMAGGAGALGLALGGPASYGGVLEQRSALGDGKPAAWPDIARAWQLLLRAILLWCAVLCTAAVMEMI